MTESQLSAFTAWIQSIKHDTECELSLYSWGVPCHCIGRQDGREQAERELRRAADPRSETGEMTTPELVREFVAIKQADARGEVYTRVRHERLGQVVTELRMRGVLD